MSEFHRSIIKTYDVKLNANVKKLSLPCIQVIQTQNNMEIEYPEGLKDETPECIGVKECGAREDRLLRLIGC